MDLCGIIAVKWKILERIRRALMLEVNKNLENSREKRTLHISTISATPHQSCFYGGVAKWKPLLSLEFTKWHSSQGLWEHEKTLSDEGKITKHHIYENQVSPGYSETWCWWHHDSTFKQQELGYWLVFREQKKEPHTVKGGLKDNMLQSAHNLKLG